MNDLAPPPGSLPANGASPAHGGLALDAMTASVLQIREALASTHFLFVRGLAMHALLGALGSPDSLEGFAASWNDLEIDEHMADQGRYRRRRHGVFLADAQGHITQQPARAHYQTLGYNRLNGGVERWFAPLRAEVAQGAVLGTILRLCAALFLDAAAGFDALWDIEVHQFRIEARGELPGMPTPEGVHRDGVDHALVLMIRRVNIASGTTTIRSIDDRPLDSFTLCDPLDAAILDDRKVYHGVTAVQALDPALPAYRDVLVVTFRRRVPTP